MSSVVRVRGLPFETTEAELITFFSGLPVTSAIITHDMAGRPSGEGFVTFADAESAKGALSFSMQNLGRRYVEVFESSPDEMTTKASMGQAAAMGQHTDAVLRMRGLPFDVTISQVVEFFDGYAITDGNVTMGITADGKFAGQPSGEAWVQFASQDLATAAQHAKNNQSIGGRYVELFPSTAADRDTNRLKSRKGGKGGAFAAYGGMQQMFAQPVAPRALAAAAGGSSSAVKMRGLPFTVTEAEVAQFFAPEIPISPAQVTLTLSPDGRASGQGFVTFANAGQAARAVELKNRQYLGNRYVELLQEAGPGMAFVGGPVAARPAPVRAAPYGGKGGAGYGGAGAGANNQELMGMLQMMMGALQGGKGW